MSPKPRRKPRPTPAEAASARAYLAKLPRGVAAGLRRLAASIRAAVPAAKLGFSYGMPAFIVEDRPALWMAAFAKHSSLFPGAEAIRRHAALLEGFRISKGTVQFPHGQPPPAALVAKLVKARLAEMGLRS